jgi:hypothetical protein
VKAIEYFHGNNPQIAQLRHLRPKEIEDGKIAREDSGHHWRGSRDRAG